MNRYQGLVKIVKDIYTVAEYWNYFYYYMADTEFDNKVVVQLNVNIIRQIT